MIFSRRPSEYIVHALCMRKPTSNGRYMRYVCLGLQCAENSEKINGGERINVKRLFTFLFNVRAYEFIIISIVVVFFVQHSALLALFT